MKEIISKTELESSVNNTKKSYLIIKRAFDIVLSIFGLVVLLPFLLIISLLISVYDGAGKPLFVQTRVGENGQTFKMLKFRTMRIDAEREYEKLASIEPNKSIASKIKNDPRVTGIGKWLRKTGLDELPQLWNIFIGDMSFVGPRPPLPAEVDQYNDYQRLRLIVKPGLTCLWQVQPHRNEIPFDEWVQLDFQYIMKRSVKLDLLIVLRTFRAMFPGEGI